MLALRRQLMSTMKNLVSAIKNALRQPLVLAIKNMFSTIDNMLSTDRKTSLVNKPFRRSLKSICRPLEYVY